MNYLIITVIFIVVFISAFIILANKYEDCIWGGIVTEIRYDFKGVQLTFTGNDIFYLENHPKILVDGTKSMYLDGLSIGDMYEVQRNGLGNYRLIMIKHNALRELLPIK